MCVCVAPAARLVPMSLECCELSPSSPLERERELRAARCALRISTSPVVFAPLQRFTGLPLLATTGLRVSSSSIFGHSTSLQCFLLHSSHRVHARSSLAFLLFTSCCTETSSLTFDISLKESWQNQKQKQKKRASGLDGGYKKEERREFRLENQTELGDIIRYTTNLCLGNCGRNLGAKDALLEGNDGDGCPRDRERQNRLGGRHQRLRRASLGFLLARLGGR